MRNLGLFAGFIPLIIYGILAGQSARSVEVALVVSLIAEVAFCYHDLVNRFILAWATLFMFSFALIGIGAFNVTLFIPYMGILIYLTLVSVSFGSIIFGTPFTLQYARRMVDKSLREHPLFRNVNVFMTAVWGVVFLINLAVSGVALVLPGYAMVCQILTWIFLICGVVFTVIYPGYIRKKVSGSPDPGRRS
ncbi:MAG TPA: hypothetical protein VMS89_07840 [Methanoregulaceae archaeon]|nr:hypothetical protein [Methanoregulaceae archaeon]